MSDSTNPACDLSATGESGSAVGGPDIFPPLTVLTGAIVLAAVFSFAFTPLRSSQDEWWHLKAGRWISEHRSIPEKDIFTYTGENIVWHNHEWLSQVLFYQVYRWGEERAIGGLRALITFKALVIVGVFALVGWHARLHGRNWAVAFLVTMLAAEVSRRTIYPRPPIFSYALFGLTLLMLSAWKSGRMRGRWLWTLVPLMVLWSNLHGMCLLGIFVVGCHLGAEMIEWSIAWLRRRRTSSDEPGPGGFALGLRSVVFLSLLLGALVVAAVVNPSGYHIFLLGRKFTADPLLRDVISEMLPPRLPWVRVSPDGGYQFVPGYATFWIIAGLLPLMVAFNRGRLRQTADYLIAGFFLYQAVLHVRHLPLFAIAAAGPLAFVAAALLDRLRPAARRIAMSVVTNLTVLLAFAYTGLVHEPQTYWVRNAQLFQGQSMSQAEYPEPMMKFILRTRFPDRMFSQINYCGFVMWWLSPERHKLFTDNRFDVFGSEFYPLEATVVDGRERDRSLAPDRANWSEILDRYGVNFIVMERMARVNAKLHASGRWDHVYYYIPPDARASTEGFNIWLRKDARFSDVVARARENFSQEHPDWPMPGEENRD